MAELYDILKPESKYWDKKNYTTLEAYNSAIQISSTVYVGNLSFYTQQNAIKELFSRTGNVKDIIMGIDNDGNPCGFCFVMYETKGQAQLAVEYISKTRLGGRIIRVDMDPGFIEGRQKGRGSSGQQRRDDFRNKDDPQRPRKKTTSSYPSSGRGDSYRERGDSYRGGYKDRGDGNRGDRGEGYRGDRGQGYRGRQEGNRERGVDNRGGERREYRQRQNRGNYGDDRGDRRDYRQQRQQREPRQYREHKQQTENKQEEY